MGGIFLLFKHLTVLDGSQMALVQGLGLGHLLGDGLDADILVESHLARLGDAGVLGPEGGGPLHLHSKLLLELQRAFARKVLLGAFSGHRV